MQQQTIYIGQIEIPNGKIDITDPGYDRSVWCRKNDVSVFPGTYNCFLELDEEGVPQACSILLDMEQGADCEVRYFCSIGTDSEGLGFFVQKPDFSESEWTQLIRTLEGKPGIYNLKGQYEDLAYICRFPGGDGFWAVTDQGRGSYDVYADYDEGRIVGLQIVLDKKEAETASPLSAAEGNGRRKKDGTGRRHKAESGHPHTNGADFERRKAADHKNRKGKMEELQMEEKQTVDVIILTRDTMEGFYPAELEGIASNFKANDILHPITLQIADRICMGWIRKAAAEKIGNRIDDLEQFCQRLERDQRLITGKTEFYFQGLTIYIGR